VKGVKRALTLAIRIGRDRGRSETRNTCLDCADKGRGSRPVVAHTCRKPMMASGESLRLSSWQAHHRRSCRALEAAIVFPSWVWPLGLGWHRFVYPPCRRPSSHCSRAVVVWAARSSISPRVESTSHLPLRPTQARQAAQARRRSLEFASYSFSLVHLFIPSFD